MLQCDRMSILLVLFLALLCTIVHAQNEMLICTASTPLNSRRRLQAEENEMSYIDRKYHLGRRLIAYEGGAAQTWTFETSNNERVKMMFSCEPNGFKTSIFFSKRPCNSDNLNVYRVGFNSSDIPLFQREKIGPDEIIVQLEVRIFQNLKSSFLTSQLNTKLLQPHRVQVCSLKLQSARICVIIMRQTFRLCNLVTID